MSTKQGEQGKTRTRSPDPGRWATCSHVFFTEAETGKAEKQGAPWFKAQTPEPEVRA